MTVTVRKTCRREAGWQARLPGRALSFAGTMFEDRSLPCTRFYADEKVRQEGWCSRFQETFFREDVRWSWDNLVCGSLLQSLPSSLSPLKAYCVRLDVGLVSRAVGTKESNPVLQNRACGNHRVMDVSGGKARMMWAI